MHLREGQIRAYLDGEVSSSELRRVKAHLDRCSQCQQRASALAQRSEQANLRLSSLGPLSTHMPDPLTAHQRFQKRLSEKENSPMRNKIFARPYRPYWAALALILILVTALSFPSVRAAAGSFLGLFRVQHIAVVQFNPDDVPQTEAALSQLDTLLAEDVKFEELGEPQTLNDASEASRLAGIPVRLPQAVSEAPVLRYKPGARITINLDAERIRQILKDLGQGDLELPDRVDNTTVTVNIPASIMALYGDCGAALEEADPAQAETASEARARSSDCIFFWQMPSPQVDAPAWLDMQQMGEIFLQFLGMSPEEAAQFARNVDWTTTLVIPIPRDSTSYAELEVDGVRGTLIQESYGSQRQQFLLLWVKDNIIYALSGSRKAQKALEIANSLR